MKEHEKKMFRLNKSTKTLFLYKTFITRSDNKLYIYFHEEIMNYISKSNHIIYVQNYVDNNKTK